MLKSGVAVSDLFEQINNEVDIAIDIDIATMLQSYNGLMVGLYRDIIKEEYFKFYTPTEATRYKVVDWETDQYDSECVYRVYTEDLFEAEKVNPTYAMITDRICWFPLSKKKIALVNFPEGQCGIIYHVTPEIVKYNSENGTFINADSDGVPVPIDFIDMVKAKIRGDMYNIANDDDLAAKWYNIYNSRIEDFKIFISENRTEVNG